MCTTITIDEKSVDVIIDALEQKMYSINTCAIISGAKTPKIESDFAECEKALELLNEAKESFERSKVMAAEKN
jgi:hypothetical protein